VTDETEKPNIYQRMNAVTSDAKYLQKKNAQQGQGVLYDDVIAMLQPLLTKNGIALDIRQESLECISDVEGTKQKVYQGVYEFGFINVDDPKDRSCHRIITQGMDGGDKAPGKALTYAAKIVYTKVFFLETGIDDESRGEKIEKATKTIDQKQYDQLFRLLNIQQGDESSWHPIHDQLCQSFNIVELRELRDMHFNDALSRVQFELGEARKRFDANFPAWEKAIKAKKITADEVIKKANSVSPLTNDQVVKVRGIK